MAPNIGKRLVWMDTIEAMKAEVIEKIEKGFECIKLKIGALDFGPDGKKIIKAMPANKITEESMK